MSVGRWRMGVRRMRGAWHWCLYNRAGTLVMVSRDAYPNRPAAVAAANAEVLLIQQAVLVT